MQCKTVPTADFRSTKRISDLVKNHEYLNIKILNSLKLTLTYFEKIFFVYLFCNYINPIP